MKLKTLNRADMIMAAVVIAVVLIAIALVWANPDAPIG
jgi:hypothetical protein